MEASGTRWKREVGIVRLDGPTDPRVVGTSKQRRKAKRALLTTTDEHGLPTLPTPPTAKAPRTPRPKKTWPKESPWWTTRANHLALYPECRICGDAEHVHVHHLRYRGARGLGERPGDLVTLCVEHHNEFHRVYGRAGEIRAGRDGLARLTIQFIEAKRRLPL
jgi:hypothetical protein